MEDIEARIKEFGEKLAAEVSQRVKKRIFQKIGKLKKQLAELTSSGGTIMTSAGDDDDDHDLDKEKLTSADNNKKRPQPNCNVESDDDDDNVENPPKKTKNGNDSITKTADTTQQATSQAPPTVKAPTRKEMKSKLHLLNQELAQMAVKKQLKLAKKVVRKHLSKGLPLDVLTYTNYINVFVRCNDMVGAESVLEEMNTQQITPNTITYTTLLKGYCEVGDMVSATKLLFEQMIPSQQCNIRSLSTFLRGCQHTGYIDTAYRAFQTFFQEVAAGRLTKDTEDSKDIQESSCYEAIVTMLCQAGKYNDVIDMMTTYIQSIQTNKQAAVFENIGLYMTLAKAMTMAGKFPDAQKYFQVAESLISQSEQSRLKDTLRKKFDEIEHEDDDNDNNNNNKNTKTKKNANKKGKEEKMSKSTELFQSHKRHELKHELEVLEEYIAKLQTIPVPSNKAIMQHYFPFAVAESGGQDAKLVWSEEEVRVLVSLDVYLMNIVQVFVFGYDGQGDLQSHNKSNNDMDNADESKEEDSEENKQNAEQILFALQQKFAFTCTYGQALFDSLSPTSTSSSNQTEHKKALLNEWLNQKMKELQDHYCHHCLMSDNGHLNFDTLFPNNNNTNSIQNNHKTLNNNNADEEEDEEDAAMKKKIMLMQQKKIPIKLEIGAGNGDWVVAQAEAERIAMEGGKEIVNVKAYWIGLELRTERIASIFQKQFFKREDVRNKLNQLNPANLNENLTAARSVVPSVPQPHNLVILGGDARKIVTSRIPHNSIAAIFCNYPEPPERVTGEKHQGTHLLTVSFFVDLLQILQVQGTITILTDNLAYAQALALSLCQLQQETVAAVNKKNKQNYNNNNDSTDAAVPEEVFQLMSVNLLKQHKADDLDCQLQECVTDTTAAVGSVAGKVHIWRGEPGRVGGHVASTSSYFDRMWALGQKKRRWFLFLKKKVVKPVDINNSNNNVASSATSK